ncbi:hypothetical protein [Buchananella hordeovulneris]|uniref:Cell filamentation protein Fic n=1 Tax=Buchananella hordeovulneris TaxID=52770 RepID=A0A1Q5PUQ5_9ACTO|nr:hypothetical protein [Buchananella hordeovulneris]OKL51324.1 hypothetical protein BSZ40_08430 [Buchananella hordeovulneris]
MDVEEAVRALADLPGVAAAQTRVRQAAAELRWHEALRRRWREARAENAVRTAVSLAALAGARVPAEVLRPQLAAGQLVTTPTTRPAEAVALRAWHACVSVVDQFAPLAGRPQRQSPLPLPQLLAGWHRCLLGPQAGGEAAEIARPRPGSQARLRQVVEVVAANGSALVRAAVAWGELASGQIFAAASDQLGILTAWYVAVISGLEPTGVVHPALLPVQEPAGYAAAREAYASGTAAGVAQWIDFVARTYLAGAAEGRQVCDQVLAGRTA